MIKKILIILSFLIVIGAGAFGTYHFYKENQNQIQQNQALAAQNSNIQAQLNAIGEMTTVYEVAAKQYSGKEIKETDLIPVSVPVSSCNTTSITDATQLIGKFYKVDIEPGTILSTDLLMEEFDGTEKKYSRELTFESLPVSTVVGDYIDIRMIMPNGEEYVVLSHEQIKRLYDQTITINISEEENVILNSVFADLGQYSGFCYAYLTKYLEPGKDTDTVAFYPIQKDMESFVMFNPNITDTTRCINETLRDHIDSVLLVYTDSYNSSMAQNFISNIRTQYASGLSAHQMWIDEHTDEDGNVIPDDGTVTTTPDSSDAGSYDEAVGEATEQLGEDIEDLEAIQ